MPIVPLNPEPSALPTQATDDSAASADLAYLRARVEASGIDEQSRRSIAQDTEVLSVLLADRHCARTFVLTMAVLERLAVVDRHAPSPVELSIAVKRHGSQRAAARALGLPPSTLRRRLRQSGARRSVASR